jgi:hypothetical protein
MVEFELFDVDSHCAAAHSHRGGVDVLEAVQGVQLHFWTPTLATYDLKDQIS